MSDHVLTADEWHTAKVQNACRHLSVLIETLPELHPLPRHEIEMCATRMQCSSTDDEFKQPLKLAMSILRREYDAAGYDVSGWATY